MDSQKKVLNVKRACHIKGLAIKLRLVKTHLKISLIELEISTNELKISLIELEISSITILTRHNSFRDISNAHANSPSLSPTLKIFLTNPSLETIIAIV